MTLPEPTGSILLSALLRRPVIDAKDNRIGTLTDLIVRLRDHSSPLLTGLVLGVGDSRVYVPMAEITAIEPARVRLRTARLDLRAFQRREGEVLLKEDVRGHRLVDTEQTSLVRAYDIQLSDTAEGWAVTGLDVHKRSWLHLNRNHEGHTIRGWTSFLPLIGHRESSQARARLLGINQLKPAQIADIIEESTEPEQQELLAQVHTDPELEADVFEELDENRQSRILKDRTDAEVADILSHMRADDAADALMDLPQERRKDILALLPSAEHTKVLTLLGYHDATAGGLMGTDYIALPATAAIADALQAIRSAAARQPEALTTIYALHPDETLAGAINLVRALQCDPAALLSDTIDTEPITATPSDDVIDITTTMADYNLLTLPVLDPDRRVLGVITVDDALEAAIPEDWARREPHRRTRTPDEPGDNKTPTPSGH
ncbi:CBS domain-containing protein [Paenarthrobacter sp. DKR-5]|uniref:magnesium transporter MgtE N-terminal domain-containing protein n=1 Tax=Paenarthrobacter sp. DKR-5 TaxID=2835535 RepID=UPI001BDCC4E0|nr:CBS domain-containing protein [Paenarthrobacter sp. DKR-5]MBT1004039.1 CBS domain-containing protein [Paenarthrobacter sp. DKR-5]